MTVDAVLLVWSIGLMIVSGVISVKALADERPALLLFSAFFLVYLTVRPIMLLTGFYGNFAGLHFGAEAFHPEKLFPVLLYCSVALALVLLSYRAAPYHALGRWMFVWPGWCTRSTILFVASWAAVVALLSFRQISVAVGIVFGFALFGSCYLITPKERGRRSLILVSIALLGLAGTLGSSVERRDWAVAMFAIGWTVLLADSASYLRKLAYVAGLFIGVAYVAMALRTEGAVLERFTGADQSIYIGIAEWELDFSLVYDDLIVLFDKVPTDEDYLYGKSFVKPFYFWIPRAVWRDKGETLSREFSQTFNVRFYNHGGSEPLTFIGDLYWNFGWLGLAFCVVLGRVQRAIDDTYRIARRMQFLADDWLRSVRAAMATLAGMMFYVYRGPVDTVWLHFGALLLLMWILGRSQHAIFSRQLAVQG